jgi:hypothetical protein
MIISRTLGSRSGMIVFGDSRNDPQRVERVRKRMDAGYYDLRNLDARHKLESILGKLADDISKR